MEEEGTEVVVKGKRKRMREIGRKKHKDEKKYIKTIKNECKNNKLRKKQMKEMNI